MHYYRGYIAVYHNVALVLVLLLFVSFAELKIEFTLRVSSDESVYVCLCVYARVCASVI